MRFVMSLESELQNTLSSLNKQWAVHRRQYLNQQKPQVRKPLGRAEQTHLEHHLRKDKMAAEEKLRNYTTFLAQNAHDLRSPLNVIMGYSQMFLEGLHKTDGVDQTDEYAQAMLASSTHLFHLINDLLDLCRIDSEKLQLREAPANLASLIEDAAHKTRERAKQAELEFVVTLAPNLPDIFLDRQRILQAIVNLLSNSIKFTRPGGRIDLVAFLNSQGELEIHVADNGIGIKARDIPQALTDFGRVGEATLHNEPSSGLGLPLAKRLVELHGGRLNLESEYNKGTKISLILPAQRLQNHSQQI